MHFPASTQPTVHCYNLYKLWKERARIREGAKIKGNYLNKHMENKNVGGF
jgi:hypothetical protein